MKHTRILAIVLAVLMLCVTFAFAASAATPTPVAGPSAEDTTHPIGLTKYLVLDKDAPIPTVSFSFDIKTSAPTDTEKANDISTGAGPLANNNVTISYTPTDTATLTTAVGLKDPSDGHTITEADNLVAYKKTVNFDLSDVEFTKPGIYKYEVSEQTGAVTGITYDSEVYTVYVYVGFDGTDKNATSEASDTNTLKILATIFYLQDDSGNPGTDKKDEISFPNKTSSHDVTVSKSVTGNLGDKERYFEFTFEAVDASMAGSTVKIDLTHATSGENAIQYYAPSSTLAPDAVDAESKTNAATCQADASGKFSYTFYLKDGESISLLSLPEGIKYTVTETSYTDDGYKTTLKTTVKTDSGDSVTDTVTNTHVDASLSNDTIEAFTNEKENTLTGVMLEKLPFIAMAIIALGGIAFMAVSKKRKNEE